MAKKVAAKVVVAPPTPDPLGEPCVLFVTDAHARGSSPEGRTDDYPEAVYAKLAAVGRIAKQYNALAVLFGGDLFHEPDPATSVVRRVMRILKGYKCPCYTIWGSHDVFGYNERTLERTALGLVEEAERLVMLDPKRVTQIGPFDVVGLSHNYALDQDPKNYTVTRKGLEGCRADSTLIEVAHGMLLDKPFFDMATLLTQVKTDANFVMSGHYHGGYPITKIGGTTFCNPGSLGRLENTEINRTRPVSVAVVYPSKVVLVPVPCAEGAEVFSDRVVKDEGTRQALDAFVKQLHQQLGEIDTQDAKHLLLTVAKEQHVSESVCQHVVATVEKAQAELGE